MRKNENKYDGVNLMTALFRFYFFCFKGKIIKLYTLSVNSDVISDVNSDEIFTKIIADQIKVRRIFLADEYFYPVKFLPKLFFS